MAKHIVFDFDGTIADTKKIAYDVYIEIATKNKLKTIDQESFRQLTKMSIQKRIKTMRIPLLKIPLFIRQARPFFTMRIKNAPIFNEMKALLIDLKEQGFEIYILSSNSEENIKEFLAFHDITLFEHIIGKVSLFGKAKALRKLKKKQRLNSQDMLYVGDELRDIHACRKANLKMIAVTWGYDHPKLIEAASPDYLCHTVKALKQTIESIKAGEPK